MLHILLYIKTVGHFNLSKILSFQYFHIIKFQTRINVYIKIKLISKSSLTEIIIERIIQHQSQRQDY
jgi:hypothetical protein